MHRRSNATKSESHPKTISIGYLRTLNRPQIQSLAKKYGVKANLKTETIINDILAKDGLNAHRSPKVALPELSTTTTESQEPRLTEESLIVKESAQTLHKTPERPMKRAAPDQPIETKAQKRISGETVARPLIPLNHTTILRAREPHAMSDHEHNNPMEPQDQRAEKTPVSNEVIPASDDEPQISDGEDHAVEATQETPDQMAPETHTQKKPTMEDIKQMLADIDEDRKKLQSELRETRSMLSHAMDMLEEGTMFVKEMSFRRQLYEREIVDKLRKIDNSAGMTANDRHEWQEFLEKNGYTSEDNA